MANFKPLYTNANQVRLYLRRKVSTTYLDTPDTFSTLTPQEINSFIVNAESRVENDLSKHYIVPFVGSNGENFKDLPRATQVYIQEMATWKTLLLILDVYYGASEGNRGEAFRQSCIYQYEELLKKAIGTDSRGQFLAIPLAGLKLNPKALYRTEAGAPAPMTAAVGSKARDVGGKTRSKLTDMNKNLLISYGWIIPKP